jgi:hypothetical protein
MAQSIVPELQEMASASDCDVVVLLHKSLIVASKLKFDDFKVWIERELNGYADMEEEAIPEYRKCFGRIVVYHPLYGEQPVTFTSTEIDEHFTRVVIGGSVSSLISLINVSTSGWCESKLSAEDTRQLIKAMHKPLTPRKIFGVNQLATIIGAIRNRILDWTLKLEEEGILGEGITCSEREIRRAKGKGEEIQKGSAVTYNNCHFQGPAVGGNVAQSTVDQYSDCNIVQNDIDNLAVYLKQQGLKEADIAEMKSAIHEDEKAENTNGRGESGKAVGPWIKKMVGKAASGTWNVSCAVATKLLTEALKKYYGL